MIDPERVGDDKGLLDEADIRIPEGAPAGFPHAELVERLGALGYV